MGIAEKSIPYLPWLWVVGSPVTFGLLATGLVGARRLRKAATPLASGPTFDACQRLRTALGVARSVTVAACDSLAQPVLVGILRPCILLPASALAGWTPVELEMVLLHELAHVRRWDNLVNLLQRVVESLLFFHPAVWLASRQVRRDREDCCDTVVVGRTQRAREYAELLVSVAERVRDARPRGQAPRLATATASAMADHPLASRVRRILKLEEEPMLVSRSAVGVAGLLVAALVAAAFVLPLDRGLAEEKGADGESKELRIIRVYPAADIEQINLHRWLELASSRGVEASWFAKNKSIVVSAPRDIHAKVAELLQQTREQGGIGVDAPSKDRSTEIDPTEDEMTTVLNDMNRQLVGKLDRLEALAITKGIGNKEIELPKLAREIDRYQGLVEDVRKELTEIEANKRLALRAAQSPKALDQAIEFELAKDRKFASLKQQLFAIVQRIQVIVSEKGADHADVKRYAAMRDQTRKQMEEYRDRFERKAREELKNVPNEGLRAAMVEYQIRFDDAQKRLDEYDRKLADAEDRVAKMSGIDPEYRILEASVANDQAVIAELQRKLAEYRIKVLARKRRPPEPVAAPSSSEAKTFEAADQSPLALAEDEGDAQNPKRAVPFLSHDDQRVVDFVYRALGWEVEPLDEEQLAIAKEHGYDGGVAIVAHGNQTLGSPNILVGLHTQAIRDLGDLTAFLSGKDVLSLSPVLVHNLERVEGRGSQKWTLRKTRLELDAARLVEARDRFLPPRVVDTVPQAGAVIDAATVNEIGARFSQPMQDGSWSWSTSTDRGEFPETTGPPRFVPNGLGCFLPVKLKPGTKYAIRLNSEKFKNFKAFDGRPAEPYLLEFSTRETVEDKQQPVTAAREKLDRRSAVVIQPPTLGKSEVTAYLQVDVGDLNIGGDGPFSPRDHAAEAMRMASLLRSPFVLETALRQKGVSSLDIVEAQQGKTVQWLLDNLKTSFPKNGDILEVTLRCEGEPTDEHVRLLSAIIEAFIDKLQLQVRAQRHTAEDSSNPSGEPEALYDGKTLEEWRHVWSTELKMSRRLAALTAIGEFAKAGRPPGAITQLLDCATEFTLPPSWDLHTLGPTQQVLHRTLRSLTRRFDVDFKDDPWSPNWLEPLRERLAKDPPRYKNLAINLLDSMGQPSDEAREQLGELAKIDDPDIRKAATRARYRLPGELGGYWTADANDDGKLTAEEMTGEKAKFWAPLSVADVNDDGAVSYEEAKSEARVIQDGVNKLFQGTDRPESFGRSGAAK